MVIMALFLQMATGFILLDDAGDGPRLGGTCAALARRHMALTASHCLPTDEGISAYVILPGNGAPRPVLRTERHPTADLAVLISAPRDEELDSQVFSDVDDTLEEGGDFRAFGYPVEGVGQPVGRLYKGHFQRYFGYTDVRDREYFAGEMSIPAPAGLSGGPVSRRSAPNLLTAIVTTNVESYVLLDAVEEVEKDGKTLRVESRRVVTYGIAAMLHGVRDWLKGIVSEHS